MGKKIIAVIIITLGIIIGLPILIANTQPTIEVLSVTRKTKLSPLALKIRISNKGFMDLTLRNVKIKLIIDGLDYPYNPSVDLYLALPNSMLGEDGFVLRMNSYREYTIHFDVPFKSQVKSMILVMEGEITVSWYTQHFISRAIIV